MALPTINHDDDKNNKKSEKNELVVSNSQTTSAIQSLIKETRRSREQEKDAFSKERSSRFGKSGHDAINEYFAKFKRDDGEMSFRKRVGSQLDGIQSTLNELVKVTKDNKPDKGMFDGLLSGLMRLLPLAIAAASVAAPEKVKPYQTLAKVGVKGAGIAADAIKASKYAAEATHGAKALGSVGKALGKFSDSKKVHNMVRLSSGAMIAGRALEGDGVGAVGEGLSLGLNEAAQRAKTPKAKALLTAGSLATDAALIVRDWFRADDKKKEEDQKKQDNGIVPAGNGGNGDPKGGDGAFENIKRAAIITMPALVAIALPLVMGKIGMGGVAKAAGEVVTKGKSLLGIGEGAAAAGAAGAAAKGGLFSKVKDVAASGASKVTGLFTKAAPVAEGVGKVGAGAVAKTGLKLGAKAMPLLGLGLGAVGAASRAMDGDYLGALGEAASGLASTIPVIGTATSLAIQGGLMYRDAVKASNAGTEQLNKVAGESIDKLDGSAKNAVDQTGKSTDAFTKVAGATTDSTKQMNSNVADASTKFISMNTILNTGLIGFTASLGAKFIEWTTGADNVFKSAAAKLAEIGSGIWESIKNVGVGMAGAGAAAGAGVIGWAKGKYDKWTGNDAASFTGKLGSVSEKFESGGKGVSTVSSGKGDNGGVSYGKHQLSSKSGTMTQFLNSKYGAQYKNQFAGMQVGSQQFNNKYQQIAARDGTNFEKAQKDFITNTHFAPVAKAIYNATGIQVGHRSRAIQELIYSMSVQYGGNAAKIFIEAVGRDGNKLSDDQIIDRVMNRRAAGVDRDFKSSSADTRAGIKNRIEQERGIYKKMQTEGGHLKNEVDSKGSNALAPSAAKAKAGSGTAKGASKVKANADYDLDKICQVAVSNAGKKSQKKCAEYVRKAMQAGDLKKKIKGGLGDAREWGKTLPTVGWNKVAGSPQKGDIAWFPTGVSGFGHVCIFTGSVWVSDFIQKSVQPTSKKQLEYHLYRAANGSSNGAPVGSLAGAVDIDDAGGDGSSSGGAEGTEGEKNAIEKAQDMVTTGVAAIADALFNNDEAKKAVNFFDSAKVDKWNPNAKENKKGAVNMKGFDTNLYGQQSDFKYDFGKSGVDRNALFNRNAFERQQASPTDWLGKAGDIGLQRQQASGTDWLGQAGDLGGIQRQDASPTDWLGQAGDLGGIQRQEGSPIDWLGGAGSLGGVQRQNGNIGKKKKKWWEKLFSGSDSGLYGDLFSIFGLGDEYKLGKEIYGADQSDKLGEYGLKKLGDMNKDNPYGAIFSESGKILSAQKSGKLEQYGLNKTKSILDELAKNPSALSTGIAGGLNATGSLNNINYDPTLTNSMSGLNVDLTPDYEGKNSIDGIISNTNKQYANYKNAPPVDTSNTVTPMESPSKSSGTMGTTGGNNSGLGASLITRNPDSIFREVSIAVMKATIT